MLKMAMKVMAAVIGTALIGGGIAMYVLGSPLSVDTQKALEGVDGEVCEALYVGSLAANSHNTQPWKVTIDPQERRVQVELDKERCLAVADPEHHEAFITLGCYIESLMEGFAAYGYDASVEYRSEASDGPSALTAIISYGPQQVGRTDRERLDILLTRHTDKRSFHAEPPSPDQIEALLACDPALRCFPKGTSEFESIQRIIMGAVEEQSANVAHRSELGRWMRFSDAEVLQSKDGISADMLGLGRFKKALYYLTTDHGSAEGDAFAAQGVEMARAQTSDCGAFLVIEGDDEPLALIEAGRVVQRAWLLCTELGLSVQPMSAPLEIEGRRSSLSEQLNCTSFPQMILRIGLTDEYGRNALVRRDLTDYVTVLGSRDLPQR